MNALRPLPAGEEISLEMEERIETERARFNAAKEIIAMRQLIERLITDFDEARQYLNKNAPCTEEEGK